MFENFLLHSVKRSNRNLFITNLIILIGIILILVLSGRYLYNVIVGPYDINNQELISIQSPDSLQRYYVTVKGEEVAVDTGLSDIEQEYNKYTKKVKKETYKADYLFLPVDDKILTVKVPHGEKPAIAFTGALKSLPLDVETELLNMLTEQKISKDEFKGRMLPLILEVDNFKNAGYIEMSICLLLLLFVLYNIFKFTIRNMDPYKHPIYRKLSKYGETLVLEGGINNEFASPESVRIDKINVGKTWIAVNSFFSTNFIKTDELLWIYKKVTKHSYNFIPTGKSYELIINLRDKRIFTVKMNDFNVDTAIDRIYEKAPWVIIGYSDELKAIWQKNFSEFIAGVESRKVKQNDTELKF